MPMSVARSSNHLLERALRPLEFLHHREEQGRRAGNAFIPDTSPLRVGSVNRSRSTLMPATVALRISGSHGLARY